MFRPQGAAFDCDKKMLAEWDYRKVRALVTLEYTEVHDTLSRG